MHTNLCLKRAELKKRFHEIDETLLNLGEELNDSIKIIVKQLFSIVFTSIEKRGKISILS